MNNQRIKLNLVNTKLSDSNKISNKSKNIARRLRYTKKKQIFNLNLLKSRIADINSQILNSRSKNLVKNRIMGRLFVILLALFCLFLIVS